VSLIYKILPRAEWAAAVAAGVFSGSAIDLKDGFIHFSAEDQWLQTLGKHFAGQGDLVLVAVEAAALGPALKWEVSRGGALFPHLYGPMPTALAHAVQPVEAPAAAAR
jgi:uncharacterized protein (DUF952 family)